MDEFLRTEMLIGRAALEKLANSKVAVFGIGGVGSFAAEALARAGVGRLVLVDDDVICVTNINRQLHALHKTIGQPKVEIMRDRIMDINPRAEVEIYQIFYTPEVGADLLQTDLHYVVDAIDTVTAKIDLVVRTAEMNLPIISCMGTGNKMDASRLEIADISQTSVCPLAKVMRRELKKRGITSLKVVYSPEEPIKPLTLDEQEYDPQNTELPHNGRIRKVKRQVPGSISFVPSVAGLLIAGEVVRDLIKDCENQS